MADHISLPLISQQSFAQTKDNTPLINLDSLDDTFDLVDNPKQSFDFFSSYQSSDLLAPHPDQFELELDSSLAAFDQELASTFIPVATEFSLFRGENTGPASSFTVSSESVSGYESVYTDTFSTHSEALIFGSQSPASNYHPSSVYSLTQEQLDMDFQRMGLPTDDIHSFGALPSSPSLRSSPGSVPNISHYSPAFSSPRGSFSDYEPAQPQQVRIGSSAASEYYPQTHVPIHKYATNARLAHRPVSSPSVSPQMSHISMGQRKMENIHEDPKRKYQCPSCPRSFARAYNLKTHIQTHDPNRSKPYACHHKSCGRAFSRKHDLTRHMVSIHRAESVAALAAQSVRPIGVDGARRSWCDRCGKGFVGKDKEKACDCSEDEK